MAYERTEGKICPYSHVLHTVSAHTLFRSRLPQARYQGATCPESELLKQKEQARGAKLFLFLFLDSKLEFLEVDSTGSSHGSKPQSSKAASDVQRLVAVAIAGSRGRSPTRRVETNARKPTASMLRILCGINLMPLKGQALLIWQKEKAKNAKLILTVALVFLKVEKAGSSNSHPTKAATEVQRLVLRATISSSRNRRLEGRVENHTRGPLAETCHVACGSVTGMGFMACQDYGETQWVSPDAFNRIVGSNLLLEVG